MKRKRGLHQNGASFNWRHKMENELYQYLFKNVELTPKGESPIKGYVVMYCSAEENAEDIEEGEETIAEESIGIKPNKQAKSGVEYFKSEIESIKVLS